MATIECASLKIGDSNLIRRSSAFDGEQNPNARVPLRVAPTRLTRRVLDAGDAVRTTAVSEQAADAATLNVRQILVRSLGVAAALMFVLSAPADAANERTIGTIVGAGLGGAVGGVKGAVVGGAAGNLVGAVVKNERAKSKSAAAPAAAPASAPEAETQKTEPANAAIELSDADVVADATPILHHTCRSLVESHGDDQAAIEGDIRKMVALSVANRGIDLSDPPMSEETREEIRAEFSDELGDRCALDADAVLIGVIDGIVADLAKLYR